jgi:ergothioneine biosynthesis protein EgtC
MCRFAVYLGDEITLRSLVTEPANSIINQSYQSSEQEEPLNGDGFGIAWYVPELSNEPALYKEVSPAWNNLNLLNLAKVTTSHCIFAHVRAATPGIPVTQLNCHPFTWNQYALMHNGRVAQFRCFKRKLLESLSDQAFECIKGSTDSEHVLALLTDYLAPSPTNGGGPAPIAEALAMTIGRLEQLRQEAGVDEPSLLNLAVTDGTSVVASRFISDTPEKANSLYYRVGKSFQCDEGVCRMVNDNGRGAVIVASEPLTKERNWIPVPPNCLVTVDPELSIQVVPIGEFW